MSFAAATPALAQEGTRGTGDQQVVLTGRVTVSEGESTGTVVIFDGPATIEGTVRGDVVAFNGRVDVSGHVTRNVVAFNGPVTLGSTAEVDGDLVTLRLQPAGDGALGHGLAECRHLHGLATTLGPVAGGLLRLLLLATLGLRALGLGGGGLLGLLGRGRLGGRCLLRLRLSSRLLLAALGTLVAGGRSAVADHREVRADRHGVVLVHEDLLQHTGDR